MEKVTFSQEPAHGIASRMIPAECFGICNDAYVSAETTGKTPALCEPDSDFMRYYTGCETCSKDAGGGSVHEFDEYFQYCDQTNGTPVPSMSTLSASIGTGWPTFYTVYTTVYTSSSLIGTWISGPQPVITEVTTIPRTISGSSTYIVLTTVEIDFAADTSTEKSSTTTSSIPPTSFTSFTSATSATSATSSVSSTSSTTPTTSTNSSSSSSSQNLAWIAGPIIGGIAVICVIVLVAFLWGRRSAKRSVQLREHGEEQGEQAYKPQLEGQPRHQLETREWPQELHDDRAEGVWQHQ